MKIETISLLDLNNKVKSLIKNNPLSCWITAEISELKILVSGHAYLELVQKNDKNDQIVARSRATIWASTFRMVKPYFESTTGQPFSEGLLIMVKVTVDFHEVFGISLNISDIEPSYTVGELALRKQKVIRQLTDEGVLDMNRELSISLPCQRIAVISSATAAGWGDFCDQLINNAFGYKFYFRLFPAIMQGSEAENSIIAALDLINRHAEHFDATVIIRGGGSQADLQCFNSYWLAYNITQFPLPVLTGIGHEQDDSVVDFVAHTRLKTPTAVATFLIDNLSEVDDGLQELQRQIFDRAMDSLNSVKSDVKNTGVTLQRTLVKQLGKANIKLGTIQQTLMSSIKKRIFGNQLHLSKSIYRFKNSLKITVLINNSHINTLTTQVKKEGIHFLVEKKLQLLSQELKIDLLDPFKILKKGYTITYQNKKVVKNVNQLKADDIIETQFESGTIISKVKKDTNDQ